MSVKKKKYDDGMVAEPATSGYNQEDVDLDLYKAENGMIPKKKSTTPKKTTSKRSEFKEGASLEDYYDSAAEMKRERMFEDDPKYAP